MRKVKPTTQATPVAGRSVFRLNSTTSVLTFVILILLGLNIYFISRINASTKKMASALQVSNPCSVDILRLTDENSRFTRPLLLAESEEEDAGMLSLKNEIAEFIRRGQSKGDLQTASVYLKDFNSGGWTSISGDNRYHPGSLMKVPILIYYLKEEEGKPGMLKREFLYEKPQHSFPSQNFMGDSIIPGKRYAVSDLLRYMIVESDNNSTYVLGKHIDQDKYKELFSDLDLPVYEVSNTDYSLSPKQYSVFIRLLFNATYLRQDLSEYGLKLLSECKFREGLVRQLPAGTIVAHKFGERGIDGVMDFSESGIVYINNSPYLLTIMTRGANVATQTKFVSDLSLLIYNHQRRS